MNKSKVPAAYPPEEGCYLRGNDFSPVAVVILLVWSREETPPEIEHLVRTGLETGAALSGTLQTENVGIEKVICNVIANPNIRYLIVCGPESPGHVTGGALRCLYEKGIDKNRRIIDSESPAPYLYNIPVEWVARFRQQTEFIDLINEGSPEVIRDAVWSCYQEEPTGFKENTLYDKGVLEAEPICGKITWKIVNPAYAPKDEKEQEALIRMQALIQKLKERNENKG
jgi:tetrahydromethanopterin S-methyltransferase subunit A